jgi:hypothetical protein
MAFETEPEAEKLAAVLEMLPPPIDSDHIPIAGIFLVWAVQRWEDIVRTRFPFIAAAVLASNEWELLLIPADVLESLIQGLALAGEDNLPTFLLGYQGSFLRLMQNLERMTVG